MSSVEEEPKSEADEATRIGYEIAVNLWTYEGGLCWSQFNAMLVANSIVVAVLGFAAASQKSLLIISYGGPFLGMALCALWIVLVARGFSVMKYWIWSARELEGKLPLDVVKTVSRGAIFAMGRPVTFMFDGQPHTHQLSWIARRNTAQRTAKLIIAIFVALYAGTLAQAIFG
jgi:hypothetical protein